MSSSRRSAALSLYHRSAVATRPRASQAEPSVCGHGRVRLRVGGKVEPVHPLGDAGRLDEPARDQQRDRLRAQQLSLEQRELVTMRPRRGFGRLGHRDRLVRVALHREGGRGRHRGSDAGLLARVA
jgi:hypothetical protein